MNTSTFPTPERSVGLLPIEHRAERSSARGADESTRGYLSFRVGREEYCIDILKVQEIRSYTEPTRMAGAPAFIRGVIDLRGVIVPVVDLRLKFGLEDVHNDGNTVVIILNVAQRVIGVVVDAVRDVVELRAEQIREAPSFTAEIDSDFIQGLASLSGADGERLLIVTDIERLISGADMGLFRSN